MDVKHYYRKIREIESSLSEAYVLVISLETADGGKAGVISEVTRSVAAKLIVEGRAVMADQTEQENYRAQQAEAQKIAQKRELARRVHVAIIADPNIDSSESSNKINISSITTK